MPSFICLRTALLHVSFSASYRNNCSISDKISNSPIEPNYEAYFRSTEVYKMVRSRFGEVCSCCCLPALPGPAQVLLNQFCAPFCAPLYRLNFITKISVKSSSCIIFTTKIFDLCDALRHSPKLVNLKQINLTFTFKYQSKWAFLLFPSLPVASHYQ